MISPCHIRRVWRTLRSPLMLLLFTATAYAHIGSPDTFVQAAVGPYTVLIAVHPPSAMPGAMELDLRVNPDDRLTSVAASLDDANPVPLQLIVDGTASTSLWIANPAAHTLHIQMQGSRGAGDYTVKLPANVSPSGLSSAKPLLTLRLVLLFSLLVLATIFLRKRLRFAVIALTLALFTVALFHDLRPAPRSTVLSATLTPSGHLDFSLINPHESFADLVPDHGKLLHLFLVREPTHDVFLHLHPTQLLPGSFDAALPAMPPGTYTLFADLYHANGAGETAALRLTLPQQSHSTTQDSDDSSAVLRPASTVISTAAERSGETPVFGATAQSPPTTVAYRLPSGYTLTLLSPQHLIPLHANLFTVTLLDPAGHPPNDMALYLGMSAHAVVLRSDDQVFAHIHPGGTLPMLGAPGPEFRTQDAAMSHSMPTIFMPMPTASNTPTIPYGFPTSGHYRLFIQMKHGPIVETAAFDLKVD